MFADIALLSPPYSVLTYEIPPEFPAELWRPGLRVAAPLGGRGHRAGLLLALKDTSGLPEGAVCKPLCWPLETSPLARPELLLMLQDMALRQGLTVGRILGHVLPKGLRSTKIRLRRLCGGRGETFSLSHVQRLPPGERARLAREMCAGGVRLLSTGEDAAEEELCVLRADPPWPVRPGAARQLAVLEFLHEHGPTPRRNLLRRLGPRAAHPLRALAAAGHVALERGEKAGDEHDGILPSPPFPFELNAGQAAAVADLLAALDEAGPHSRLLFGVTGSGKTAVYLELAKACLARGKSMLLLAPEVALAQKLKRDAAGALPGAPIFLYHGYQSAARREAVYRELGAREDGCLVVGTRSALFLPVSHPGCIVLDEEHDASYKQDEKLFYHARELAWFRMRENRGLLLLASATPDLKTWHAARTGVLPVLRLPRRVTNRPLPPVEMVNLRNVGLFAEADGMLAPESEDALRRTLAKGEQAVVLLNRRGYAPLVYCLECGRTQRCPQCEIGLTYHKGREKLVCHYCGHAEPFPSPCLYCRGMNFLPLGEGTERLAERLATLAGGPVLRLDRDSARRPDRMEEILSAFARQESPVLVGTQMLSKGHHFPRVTLVVAADGDLGLNLPDYRAAERTFQLLVQAAGRAGRGEKPGRVLIQTRDTEHYCWRYVRDGDAEGFYAEELERRRLRGYPPFVRLALLRISFAAGDSAGPAVLGEVAAAVRARGKALGVRVLGPAPAPLSLLRGRRRFHCLLKGQNWPDLRQLYFWAGARDKGGVLRIDLDIDPVNMM
ncbi:MAG: primosomal protein N' [Desulfovibrio sp.]|jgi:primosomal protein N' (replication factor Y)|nr:primosomal protein N' [Desulfovibrio sp.]